MGARNYVLDVVEIGRFHSYLRGVTSRRCGLYLSNYFRHFSFAFFIHMKYMRIVHIWRERCMR